MVSTFQKRSFLGDEANHPEVVDFERFLGSSRCSPGYRRGFDPYPVCGMKPATSNQLQASENPVPIKSSSPWEVFQPDQLCLLCADGIGQTSK